MSLKKTLQYGTAFCALLMFAGCKSEEAPQNYGDAPPNTDTHGHDHDHDHAHEHGPHGGHVIELASDHSFHGEVTFTAEGRKITIYILGSDLETAVPVDLDAVVFEIEGEKEGEEIALPLTAAPLEGEPEGKSSVFVVEGDKVPAAIDDIEKLHGHVHVTIDGKEYEGAISHDHDHDHDHDHEGEKKPEGDAPAEKPEAAPETGSDT